jgi:hypothetical protein
LSVCLAGLLLLTATAAAKQPDEGRPQTGISQSSSLYVQLHDGVEIAVSLYVPKDLKANDRIPVLMRTTRYWREPQKTCMLKMLALHLVRSSLVTDPQVKYFNERRFAVLLVDADQNSLFAVCHLPAAAKGSSDSSVAGRGRRRRVSALSGRRHASVDRVSTGAERIIS